MKIKTPDNTTDCASNRRELLFFRFPKGSKLTAIDRKAQQSQSPHRVNS